MAILAAPSASPRRRTVRVVVLAVAVAVASIAAVEVVQYRRQIASYLTHWKGSPTHTDAYVPAAVPPDLRVAVAGDVGDSGSRLTATGAAIARLGADDPFDALLLLGDNVYPRGDPSALPSTVFEPFGDVLDAGTDLLAIIGNHDQPHGDAQMAALGMPGRWWAESKGDALFVGLDSNEPQDPTQLQWLEDTLRSSSARWKIVAVHHPPYSAGYQGSNADVQRAFVPIFERYGVQLVLSGHDHDYQRSKVLRGVTYVVTGAAAGTRRTGDADFTAVSFSWHSYVELRIYPDRIEGLALNQDNRVADEWTIR